jgi:glucokinase
MKYALGIDLGGTNVKALAVTPAGRVLAENSVPTADTGKRHWIANVEAAIEPIRHALGAAPAWIGVAAPGLVARDQRSISYMPGRLAGLAGCNWQKLLRVRHPVPVLNDGHAALLGEVWLGAARNAKNALLLTLGTGVGGAALVDGRLLRGHLGRAGHLGHISLDPDGVSDIVRTPGSLEDAIGECTVKARSRGRFASTQELVVASDRNERAARAIWLKSIHALAAALASLINAFDPEVIVIGGGIAKAGPSLFDPLNERLGRIEWRPGGARVRICPAKLASRAGAFGAAWYGMNFEQQL